MFHVSARNYSVFALPIAWMLSEAVSTQVPLQLFGLGPGISSHEDFSAASAKLSATDVAKLKRRKGAHHDGLQHFPLFAASVIVGNEAGLNAGALNALSLGYLVSRGIYTWLSITLPVEKTSYVRYHSPYDVC
jgi:hypothetical protein